MHSYDFIVIGSGAAGLTAAFTANGIGKKVLLIEKNKPGGECTWTGCIPSKALIHLAEKYQAVADLGIAYKPDIPAVLDQVRSVIDHVYAHESIETLRKAGIDVIIGAAKFVGPKTVEVAGASFTGKRIVICTGSQPLVPAIPGLAETPHLTNENLFTQKDLPGSLLVLGAGAIGVEMGQALNRLGISIDLVDRGKLVLSKDDPDHTTLLMDQLEKEGVHLHMETTVQSVRKTDQGVEVTVDGPEGPGILKAAGLLVALGRTVHLDSLDLEKAGINYNNQGIVVDPYLQTTVKGVFAAGDCIGPYRFSHMANAQGMLAVQNGLLPINLRMKYNAVPWCTFTSPEIAHTGMSEEEAWEVHGDRILIYTHDFAQLDRAITAPGTVGQVKIITDRKARILGASVIGDRAGEILSEIQVAMTQGIKLSKFARIIHPYPTYAEVLTKMGKKAAIYQMRQNPLVRLLRGKPKADR